MERRGDPITKKYLKDLDKEREHNALTMRQKRNIMAFMAYCNNMECRLKTYTSRFAGPPKDKTGNAAAQGGYFVSVNQPKDKYSVQTHQARLEMLKRLRKSERVRDNRNVSNNKGEDNEGEWSNLVHSEDNLDHRAQIGWVPKNPRVSKEEKPPVEAQKFLDQQDIFKDKIQVINVMMDHYQALHSG